jgi:hypothetical protein
MNPQQTTSQQLLQKLYSGLNSIFRENLTEPHQSMEGDILALYPLREEMEDCVVSRREKRT